MQNQEFNYIELFGGIGACTEALKRLIEEFGFVPRLLDYVEIDKYAVASFNEINNTNFEPQDITTWDKEFENVDLIMHGSPCQSVSLAGLGKGADEGTGTPSSLMYESIRIIKKLKPKYVIWENVKGLLSPKHKHNFDNYINVMDELGYESHYKVLDTKDFGVPQHRERIFTISIRKDLNQDYEFPIGFPLETRLKDILDEEVEEKYFLTEEQIKRIKTTTYQSGKRRIQEKDWCDTLCARDWKDPKCIRIGGMWDTETRKRQCGAVYDGNGLSPTLNTMQGGWRQPIVKTEEVVRKLTPHECWKLQGFSDDAFEKAESKNSNTQLYKQAGNSITVDTLYYVVRNLLKNA